MDKRILHIPAGTRDIYGEECRKKVKLENNILDKMGQYGFDEIQLPTFEYFDVFNKERGTVASKDMYKFVDRDGETLVLRPDMTPQIARCVAKYYREDEYALRLSYCGNTYINYPDYSGKLKESTQLGAELINDGSVFADAEMIAMTADCILSSGIDKFRIEVGQTAFYKALVKEAGISEDMDAELRNMILDKNIFTVQELLDSIEIKEEIKKIFLKLTEMSGGLEDVLTMKKSTANPEAVSAIERLEKLDELLKYYGVSEYVAYDLGMLPKYDYYTGVTFKAYTYKTGEPIAAGGRYDKLVGQFGTDKPAIGVAIYADQLLAAKLRQNIEDDPAEAGHILEFHDDPEKVIKQACELRKKGEKVIVKR